MVSGGGRLGFVLAATEAWVVFDPSGCVDSVPAHSVT